MPNIHFCHALSTASLCPIRQMEASMDFRYSAKVVELQEKVSAFMAAHVYPNEARYEAEVAAGDRWAPSALIEELKGKARSAGLWNLFLPDSEHGAGLTN